MRDPQCADCRGLPVRGKTLCAPCAKTRKRRQSQLTENPRAQRITNNTPFCLECIASGGYHRVGCAARKEAA